MSLDPIRPVTISEDIKQKIQAVSRTTTATYSLDTLIRVFQRGYASYYGRTEFADGWDEPQPKHAAGATAEDWGLSRVRRFLAQTFSVAGVDPDKDLRGALGQQYIRLYPDPKYAR
jgi:hypothetical protein